MGDPVQTLGILSGGLDGLLNDRGVMFHSSGAKDAFDDTIEKVDVDLVKAVMEEIAELQFINWIVARDTTVRTEVEKLFSRRLGSNFGVDEPFKWVMGSYKDRLEQVWNQAGNNNKTKADAFLHKFEEVLDDNLKVREL